MSKNLEKKSKMSKNRVKTVKSIEKLSKMSKNAEKTFENVNNRKKLSKIPKNLQKCRKTHRKSS